MAKQTLNGKALKMYIEHYNKTGKIQKRQPLFSNRD